MQTDTVSLVSAWAFQQTSNNYGYAISAVAGLTVVGSAIYMIKKRKVVDDDFSHIWNKKMKVNEKMSKLTLLRDNN